MSANSTNCDPFGRPRSFANPGTREATTPGSFANQPRIGTAYAFSSPDTPGMPRVSDKTAWDFLPDGWSSEIVKCDDFHQVELSSYEAGRSEVVFAEALGGMRRVFIPSDFEPNTQLESARVGVITPEMKRVSEREGYLTAVQVRDEVGAGRMVIPANKVHLGYRLDPMAIGRASTTKINANIGASPVSSGTDEEIEKLDWAVKWGADTVMDLSTGGDIEGCREAIIKHSTVPTGMVPIYSMIIGRRLEDLNEKIILEALEHQCKQGIDYATIHAGVLKEHLALIKNRLIGIVSRGGSLLAKWMLTHNRQNIMYDMWDALCDVLHRYDVTFSIGDGLRPGGLADATDDAQLAELRVLGELTERAWRKGVQVMIEGPGHVPFDQIEYNAKIERLWCHGAPFYVLGPLVTDVFPGYDHITSAIGATAIAYHGASMLCYVTPKEHLGLPKKDDVKQGCIAYKIAAHAADVALGIPGARDWDDELTKARAALNWEEHFELAFDTDTARAFHDEDLDVDTDFCAMCGHDWCSVRISKEIQEFASGKEEKYAWDDPKISAALTDEQKAILQQRGVLSPEEIHRLASKKKEGAGGGEGDPSEIEVKPVCHSDFVDDETAKHLQEEVREELTREQLVPLNTAEAHNISKVDSVI